MEYIINCDVIHCRITGQAFACRDTVTLIGLAAPVLWQTLTSACDVARRKPPRPWPPPARHGRGPASGRKILRSFNHQYRRQPRHRHRSSGINRGPIADASQPRPTILSPALPPPDVRRRLHLHPSILRGAPALPSHSPLYPFSSVPTLPAHPPRRRRRRGLVVAGSARDSRRVRAVQHGCCLLRHIRPRLHRQGAQNGPISRV